MTLYETIKAEIEKFIAETKADFANGLDFGDLLAVCVRGVKGIVKITQATGADNAAKKEAAMLAFTTFYDAMAAILVKIPGLDVVVKPFARWLILAGASALIDCLVDVVFHPDET